MTGKRHQNGLQSAETRFAQIVLGAGMLLLPYMLLAMLGRGAISPSDYPGLVFVTVMMLCAWRDLRGARK